MYKIIEINHEDAYGDEPSFNMRKEIFFNTKAEAWQWFNKSIAPEYRGKDFFAYFGWNEREVVSTHYAEGGDYCCAIQKWEGFDDDVEIAWEFNGTLHHSVKELANAYPQYFSEEDVPETDTLVIRGCDDKFATLHVEVKNKDLEETAEERKKKMEEIDRKNREKASSKDAEDFPL